MRRMRHLLPAALLALAASGCSTDDVLSIEPTTVVPASGAIGDVVSARAAVFGMYDALQSGSYYGESFVNFVELSSDNALHSGTFSTYATADNYQVTSENTTVGGIWTALYRNIARANAVIEALTAPTFVISEDEQDQFLGEAYFMRALSHHNLVKLWGDVPVITTTITDPAEAGTITRAATAAVYTQILADLDAAESRMGVTRSGTQASLGAVRALRARVKFYRADYAGALAAADAVIAMGYALAPTYSSLFDERGNATTEDILRVRFNDQDAGSVSYYYMAKGLGGRREVSSTSNMRAAYEAGDVRRTWSLGLTGSGQNYVAKFRSVVGTEHIHVIRFAEVLLIKAESQARLNDLVGATTTLNLIRTRAGLAGKVLGVSTGYTTQAEVISTIIRERRVELAFEGDRWPDLIRAGLAVGLVNATCGASACPQQAIYPIPQTEIDVAPGLIQTPGY